MERVAYSMEIDAYNIKRLLKIYRRYITRNRRLLLLRFLAYVYLFGAFCFMALFFSYNNGRAINGLDSFFIFMLTCGLYLIYVIINHLIVRIVIPHKILFIFDLLALMMMLCINVSDFWVRNKVIIDSLIPYLK